MKVGDPAHRQSWQISHLDAAITGYRQWQRPDGGRLINDEQHPSMGRQPRDQRPQARLVLRERFIEKLFPLAVKATA
ncbi:hypothetical protein GCM10027456_82470 [Kineosporia babensis]